MSPWINYHHLYYFKVIAEEGSVSKAAEKLKLGQPTLSAQLKQFEETIGVQLFLRKHKKLVLTEHGQMALDYAKNIFQLGSEMYEVLHDRLQPRKRSLHIGALDSVPKQVISKVVQKALKISPCQVTLSEGNAGELLRELSAHQMDLVLTNFLPAGLDSRGFFHKSVAKKNVAFFASPKFKELKKGFPASISGVPLIFPTYDSRVRQDLDHWAKLNGVSLNIAIESQDISVKKLLATQGVGLIACASYTVANQLKLGELVKVGQLKGVVEELFLLSAERKIKNEIASELMSGFTV